MSGAATSSCLYSFHATANSPHTHTHTHTHTCTPQVFEEPGLPLLLDIGCAKGRWAERMAGASPAALSGGRHNFLGVELFAPLVAAANARRDAAGGGFCWATGVLRSQSPHFVDGKGRGVRLCDHKGVIECAQGCRPGGPSMAAGISKSASISYETLRLTYMFSRPLSECNICSLACRAAQPALRRCQHQRRPSRTGSLFACIMPVQGVAA